MSLSRWQAVSQSQFAWEREALDWLRNHLPDREPWHAWTNFEFIDEEGKVNEVDALVLTPAGLFLIEIKSRPGEVSGDAHTWLWVTDGRERAYDNPLILANRKSKRLASLLRRQSSVFKAKVRLPFVEPLIFLSATSLNCKLSGTARSGTYLRGQPNSESDTGIIDALQNGSASARAIQPNRIDHQHARVLARAMAEAGIRRSNKDRKVGDYQLGALLSEGGSYQDWEGTHTAMAAVRRRVRIYTVAAATTPDARKSLVRQAQREFQILEGIDHPGIVKVKDYQDTELGPALIFDHDPKAIRLDFLLRERPVSGPCRRNATAAHHELADGCTRGHAEQRHHRSSAPYGRWHHARRGVCRGPRPGLSGSGNLAIRDAARPQPGCLQPGCDHLSRLLRPATGKLGARSRRKAAHRARPAAVGRARRLWQAAAGPHPVRHLPSGTPDVSELAFEGAV
ncbi:NERD domain-containing protein [Accumulibacter sp.]|nr:NERD domain-containing protein [Accumulibacter sp.]